MLYHDPALLNESVDGIMGKVDGRYVDLTFGAGGHSKEILNRLSEKGKLYAFDQDPDAKKNAEDIDDSRLEFIQQNFIYLKNFLKLYQAIPVQGVLADLGVSFHQFDEASRGFSFRFEGPLDMRMDQARKLTAEIIVNDYPQEELERIFKVYGEIRNYKELVAIVIAKRNEKRIKTTSELKAAVQGIVPNKYEHKYLAQLFQALRIEVNEELKVIEGMLEQATEVMEVGAKLAVITYHSLEDRLVKNFFKTGNFKGEVKKDFFGNIERPLKPVNTKPIVPSQEEISRNNRSRSAKLRIAEKLNA
jgi:16S rRNA (cytosine1402-N4)-methyltransferase